MITQPELRALLLYRPYSGIFVWRVSPAKGVPAGTVAGSLHPSGHVYISIKRRLYAAHRLAWLYQYGHWPASFVDHINGDGSDNRLSNLRLLDRTKNLQAARKARADSRSGLLGACYRKDVNKWQARIQRDHVSVSLGLYDSAEEAHLVYLLYKLNF
jgi:hypothetical protein